MKIIVWNPEKTLGVEVEAEDMAAAWLEIAQAHEALCSMRCGNCGQERVKFDVRYPKGYVFRSLTCLECGARLEFGETKEGGRIFPKRKDKDGNALDNDGWEIWKPRYDAEQTQAKSKEPVDEATIPF